MHPRQFVPDGERGPPVTTDERLRRPVTGTREYARRALPAPLVPSLKLRKRAFDRKITGRLGDDFNTTVRYILRRVQINYTSDVPRAAAANNPARTLRTLSLEPRRVGLARALPE